MSVLIISDWDEDGKITKYIRCDNKKDAEEKEVSEKAFIAENYDVSIPIDHWRVVNGGIQVDLESFEQYKTEIDKKNTIKQLEKTDRDMARVAEDIINLLINKNVISLDDIPISVKEKIDERNNLRAKLA